MLKRDLSPDPQAERRQLFVLTAGLGAIAAALWHFTELTVLPTVLSCIAGVALLGLVAYPWIGRDVFLLFSLVTLLAGSLVSRAIVLLLYVVGIAGLGSVLRLFRMNMLQRNFQACRARESMFMDAPATNLESFRRQS